MTVAFVERGGPDGHHNPDRFFSHLDTCYGDPNAQYRAIDRLRNMKQRDNESFAAFLPRFEKELADSGGSEWSDTICINYLEGALNDQVKDRLISVTDIPTDYPGYIRIVQTVGSRLDSFSFTKRRGYGNVRYPTTDSGKL
jgi:hypothetical protein